MPEIVRMMNGDIGKIDPVLGLFSPLPVENEYYDIIVASSAIHNSNNLFQVLRECNRVLKRNGRLVILNETPLATLRYFLKVVKFFGSVISCLIKRNFPEYSPSVSRAGIFYDPYLCDNIYTYAQWERAIKQTGFSSKLISTPYFTDKKKKHQVVKLAHFICEKAGNG
jgi:SAM-dependent methyltransferase